MMTIGDWVTFGLGAFLAFLASQWTSFSGKNWMRVNGLNEIVLCSVPFLDPAKRLLLFYLPILVMTIAACWLMPHWAWAVIIVLWVVWSWKTGIRNAYLDSRQRLTQSYEKEGMPYVEAADRAKHDVDAVVQGNK